jgi:creatinine amidohydrolase
MTSALDPAPRDTAGSDSLPALADATWPEVERAARRVLILPVGSLEQHGPHLPLDTDAFLAAAVSAAVHRARPSAGLAPVIPFGSSGEHADFAGTLSIGREVLRDTVVELARHASRDWAALLLVNGHGGNAAALRSAAELCRREGRRVAVHHLAASGMDGHAGRAETAMMLHLAPARVRMDRAQAGNTAEVAGLMPAMIRGGVRAVSANGVLGDPTAATAEEGGALVAELVAAAVAAYDRTATA